jgi:hypothetical protein
MIGLRAIVSGLYPHIHISSMTPAQHYPTNVFIQVTIRVIGNWLLSYSAGTRPAALASP